MSEDFDTLLEDLKRDEGWSPTVYEDHLGNQTIGYGFLVDPLRTGGMPETVGEFWLAIAVLQKREEISRRWPAFDDLPPGVRRAVLNMAYQMGVSGVMKFRRMRAALEAGDWKGAEDEALDSTWALQTPARALRIAALIGKGK